MSSKVFNEIYATGERWKYSDWLYRPFLKALTHAAKLPINCTVLDAGCGQGYFTSLLARLGYQATGADYSNVGIEFARRRYGNLCQFIVRDMSLPPEKRFDCVFTRSFGLYDQADFATNRIVTEQLFEYVKPGGVLLFVHHSKPWCESKPNWRHHQLWEVEQHFAPYEATCTFVLRPEVIFVRDLAFTRAWANIAIPVSRLFRRGGEMIAIVRKRAPLV